MNVKVIVILGMGIMIRMMAFSGFRGGADELFNVQTVLQILETGTWPSYDANTIFTTYRLPMGYPGVTSASVCVLGISDGSNFL